MLKMNLKVLALAGALALAAAPVAAQNTTVTTIAKGGTSATTASGARTNLGLAIGTNVQAYDADLTTWAGLTPSANAQSLVTAADYSAMRTLLGLVIGTNVQAYDADLTTWAGLTPSANAQSLVTAADYSAMRTLLGLVIGTNVQAYDADLTTWAGLTPSANAQSLVTAADYSAMRGLLDLEVGTDVQAYNARLAGIAGLASTANRLYGSDGSGNASLITLPTGLSQSAGAIAWNIAALSANGSPGSGTSIPCETSGTMQRCDAGDFGGGGGGLSSAERQNLALSAIYQAKSFAGYRRMIHFFADGYKASDGIAAGSSSNYTLDTSGGRWYPTSSSTTQTISAQSTTANPGGEFTYVDRSTALTATDIITHIGAYQASPMTVIVKIAKRNSAGNYDIVVSESFSHPGSGWSDKALASNYTVPNDGSSYYAAASTPTGTQDRTASLSRAVKSGNVTGTGQSGFTEDSGAVPPLRVVKNPTANNATVVSTIQTADASVSGGRGLIEYDDACVGCNTATLNTDLTAEVTCNNGTNWAAASLSSAGTGQAGRKVAETADTTCTSGTQFGMRLKTLNNKFLYVYGAAVSVD